MRFLLGAALAMILGVNVGHANEVVSDADLDKLIRQCKAETDNPQNKPFQTKVFCRGVKTYWEEQGVASLELPTQYQVFNSAEMKDGRFKLAETGYSVQSEPTVGECKVYREVRVSMAAIATLFTSCAQLEEMAAEGRDVFCSRVLANSDDVVGVPTGRTHSTCTGGSIGGGSNGGSSGGSSGGSHGGSGSSGSFEIGATFRDKTVEINGSIVNGTEVVRIDKEDALIGRLALRVGDVVVKINQRNVATTSSLVDIVNELRRDQAPKIFVTAWRSGQTVELATTI
jgi:hypothetical protein